jgi:hypothetical protein
MKVAYRLRRLSRAEPAVALMLLSTNVGEILNLCVRLGSDPLPELFPVAGGYLLRLRTPTAEAFPGAVRLRALAPNLLVPVDAELAPALHDDEARGLVRERGLVFLPDRRVLAFDPATALAPATLLRVENVVRREWHSLPVPRPIADRIHGIRLERSDESGDQLLDAGGEGVGTDNPRPEDAGLPARLAAKGSVAVGKGLLGLARFLSSARLARLGARLVHRGLEAAPRLSEELLGRQEAALRALLREFQRGNVERALRRALPLGGGGDRGGRLAGGSHLPFQHLLYSLGRLLGRDGPGGVWFLREDIQVQLAREYRKAADLAAAAGDYRRAAYIYGRLLRDFRAAANVLLQGGLHHDAAILFLRKVGDRLAAARAFEAAGETDRAVELYREQGDHAAAADVLQRAGEEAAALVEYRLAAAQLSSRADWLAAGELLLNRARRPDLALEAFAAGWACRPAPNAIGCGLHLLRLYAERQTPEPLFGLLAEAEEFLLPPGNEHAAGQFFNRVGELALAEKRSAVREKLRDRALLALAAKLRQRAATESRPGRLVSQLLGQSSTWDAAVVRDAEFAVRAASRPPPALPAVGEGRATRVDVADSEVTAVSHAPMTGDVFLGCEDGSVYCFRPLRNQVVRLPASGVATVAGIATDDEGEVVVVHRASPGAPSIATGYARQPNGTYRVESTMLDVGAEARLFPRIAGGPQFSIAGLLDGTSVRLLRGPLLTVWGVFNSLLGPDQSAGGLLLPSAPRTLTGLTVLLFGAGHLCYGEKPLSAGTQERHYSWRVVPLGLYPAVPEGSPVQQAPVACLPREDRGLEFAALGKAGTAHWAQLEISSDRLRVGAEIVANREGGYRSVTLVRPGLVAAATPVGIHWLAAGRKQFDSRGFTWAPLPGAIASFPSAGTGEVLVVCAGGSVCRLSVPT